MIIIQGRNCPQEIIARTRNAASALKRALGAGWTANATFAVGGEDDTEIQSILIHANKRGTRLTARWAGPLGQGALNFDGAWRASGFGDSWVVQKLTWTEFSWAIENDGPKPLTPAELAKLDQDQKELLGAIRIATEGLDARPIRVLPVGLKDSWCKGFVVSEGGGLPAMRRRCVNPANADDYLCEGPCRSSIEES